MYRTDTAGLHTEGWGRRGALVTVAAAVMVTCVCWPSDLHGHESYPKLANIYFPSLASSDLSELARWDLLVLAKRAQDRNQEELIQLREINPDIVLFAHMPLTYNGRWASPPINGDLLIELDENDWWMKDTRGNVVDLSFNAGLLNMTTSCPVNGEGRRICDWIGDFIFERLGPGGLWDGVYLDCCWDDINWVNDGLEDPIDADGDGVGDDADVLNAMWREGLDIAVTRLRELVGEDYIIATNGNNTFYACCNSSTREDFPKMHGDWYDNIAHDEYGYLTIESRYRSPRFNIINGIWHGPVQGDGEPVRSSAFERKFGFALTSTLVFGNGYFSFDGGIGLPGHCQTWWHELYDIDLGQPLGRAESVEATPGNAPWVELGDMLKLRRFSGGLAVVNPTSCTQTVQLGGEYYMSGSWNGHFYAYTGATGSVELPQNSGEVLAGSGRVFAGVPRVDREPLGGTSVLLSWDEIPGAAQYSIYRSSDPGAPSQAGAGTFLGVVTDTQYIDSALAPNQSYYYRVAAVDESDCEGQPSHPVRVKTTQGSDLSVEVVAEDRDVRLALKWQKKRELGCNVYRTAPDGRRSKLNDVLITGLGELVDDSAVPGAAHLRELVAELDGIEVVVADGRGMIAERLTENTILHPCSPNPAAFSSTISFHVGQEALRDGGIRTTLAVYDVAGRLVRSLLDSDLEPGPYSVAWDRKSDSGRVVASGCYMYALSVGGLTRTGKLTIIN